jgi:hypothetical protein
LRASAPQQNSSESLELKHNLRFAVFQPLVSPK